jgi:uncharacterized membrane protein
MNLPLDINHEPADLAEASEMLKRAREVFVQIIATFEAAGSYQQVQDSAYHMMKLAESVFRRDAEHPDSEVFPRTFK